MIPRINPNNNPPIKAGNLLLRGFGGLKSRAFRRDFSIKYGACGPNLTIAFALSAISLTTAFGPKFSFM